MAFAITGVGLVGVTAMGVAVALAAIVFLVAPRRPSNRAVALLLVLDGLAAGTGNGLMFMMSDERDAYALQIVCIAIFSFTPYAYSRVIASLDAPLARPMRHRIVRGTFLALAIGGAGLGIAYPTLAVRSMIQPWYAPWDEGLVGPVANLAFFGSGFMSLYGLACAFQATRQVGISALARTRSRFYMLAFGSRDVIVLFTVFIASTFLPADASFPGPSYPFVAAITISSAILLYVPLLAYGILHTQVLDIDLKLRSGVERGVVALSILAAFLVVSQLIQSFATQALGYVAGAVVAGLMLFALRPIERTINRLGEMAVPARSPDEAYALHRKIAIYEAAVSEIAHQGLITPRGRGVLEALRAQLSLDPTIALAAEQTVLSPAGALPTAVAA